MSELVIKEERERESLWYGKEEETSCGTCEGEKREALVLERKKRLVVGKEIERTLGLEKKKRLVVEERERIFERKKSDFRERDRDKEI